MLDFRNKLLGSPLLLLGLSSKPVLFIFLHLAIRYVGGNSFPIFFLINQILVLGSATYGYVLTLVKFSNPINVFKQ